MMVRTNISLLLLVWWWCTLITPSGCKSDEEESIIFLVFVSSNPVGPIPEERVPQTMAMIQEITSTGQNTLQQSSPVPPLSHHTHSLPSKALPSSGQKVSPTPPLRDQSSKDHSATSSVDMLPGTAPPPPGGRPRGPPIRSSSSAEHLEIIISTSVVIIVLILIAAIGMVGLVAMYRYRAARRRISDTNEHGGHRQKGRQDTSWNPYYCEPTN